MQVRVLSLRPIPSPMERPWRPKPRNGGSIPPEGASLGGECAGRTAGLHPARQGSTPWLPTNFLPFDHPLSRQSFKLEKPGQHRHGRPFMGRQHDWTCARLRIWGL